MLCQPDRAMTSAERPDGIASQPFMQAFCSLSLAFNLFRNFPSRNAPSGPVTSQNSFHLCHSRLLPFLIYHSTVFANGKKGVLGVVVISNGSLEAEFTNWRAELVGLRDREGREFMWDGNPEIWKGSSPILFPIVGMVPADRVRAGEKECRLQQHGLAPRSEFELVFAAADKCVFRLASNDSTRELYPFDFQLDVAYALDGLTLTMSATVANLSPDAMPFSFGLHPGFCWPLPGAGDRGNHFIEFERNETCLMRRPLDGLLDPQTYASPIVERRIALHDALFAQGAMMFFEPVSQRLRFGTEGGPSLDVGWRNLPHLALWTKPGANYLCIEPWQGFSAPVGFTGDLSEKPGILVLPPNRQHSFEMTVTVNNHDREDRSDPRTKRLSSHA